MSEDVPLIADPMATPFGSPVIDLAEVRIRFGRADRKVGIPCAHKNLTYSREERRVWCDDCERTVDTFDALMTVAAHFHKMEYAAQAKMHRATEALKATVTRRAAKVIDKAWSGNQMAIACPHCRTGLLPEDFENGGSQVSAEIERARRNRPAQPPGAA